MTEKQIEKIKKKIRKHRAFLRAEKRKLGWYDDSYGKRYIIGMLYIQIEDYKSALRYFNWFDKEFSDDVGFPDFLLTWCLSLFKSNKLKEAEIKAIEVSFSNTYLIPLLLRKKIKEIRKSELSSVENINAAKYMVAEWKDKYNQKDFNEWLSQFLETPKYQSYINEFIDIKKKLLLEDEVENRKIYTGLERNLEKKLKKELQSTTKAQKS